MIFETFMVCYRPKGVRIPMADIKSFRATIFDPELTIEDLVCRCTIP